MKKFLDPDPGCENGQIRISNTGCKNFGQNLTGRTLVPALHIFLAKCNRKKLPSVANFKLQNGNI
jgi:hypothetical protein